LLAPRLHHEDLTEEGNMKNSCQPRLSCRDRHYRKWAGALAVLEKWRKSRAVGVLNR
jgi:hypothetical protein